MPSALRKTIAQKIKVHRPEVCAWYQKQVIQAPPPVYSSVDIRDSGFKITTVDCNLYPAGFNNICEKDALHAQTTLADEIRKQSLALGLKNVGKVLILPEAHTKNRFYASNLSALTSLLLKGGLDCRLGWLGTESTVELENSMGDVIRATKAELRGKRIACDAFDPDVVLLNNDFSSGYPEWLDRVEQPILPSHRLGWHARKKSRHFVHYNALALEFATILGLDPWIFQIDSRPVSGVSFGEGTGLDRVRAITSEVLSDLETKHRIFGIDRPPRVFIKNDQGTYGIGIMSVGSLTELDDMNRRTKNKMSVGKGSTLIESVLIQEAVPTAFSIDGFTAEPVIYLAGCETIGGFLRTHESRGPDDNLNAPGMVLRKFCMSDLQAALRPKDSVSEEPVTECVYGAVARLSAFAAGRELKELFTQ